MGQRHRLPVAALCCQNERCSDYGKQGVGNLDQHNWVDRQPQRIRHLRCRTCTQEWSERKGTPWYPAKRSEATAIALAQHVAEGDGMRQTARWLGTHHDTVIRWHRKLGEHGQALHEERVRHGRVKAAQADERWACVGKTRGPRRPHRPRG
jgi:transposase-like protein